MKYYNVVDEKEKNMKAAIMPEAGKIELLEVNLSELKEDEVLVKVKAVGICTFEQGFYYGKSKGFPFVGGHEISGVIEKIGSEVNQDINVGDKVAVLSLTRCGECYYCRRGYDNQCENASNVQKIKGYDGPGGFAEYFIAKGYEIYKLDPNIPLERAILTEPLACVVHSLNLADIKQGDFVLICGAGTMGILHLLLLKIKGAKVIISEPNDLRRTNALEFGADYVVNPTEKDFEEKIMQWTKHIGVEKAFFTAGGKKAIENALSVLAIRGTLVIYGGTAKDDLFIVDPKLFHYKEISITGATKHTKDSIRIATELLNLKEIEKRLDAMITKAYPFKKIEESFWEAKKEESYRVIVKMD